MKGGLLRVGLSASIMHPDPARVTFNGRRLLFIEESMAHYVLRHGALPFVVPSLPGGLSPADLVASLDCLIVTGGVDMAPESYGEAPLKPEWAGDRARDLYELALIKEALAQDKPVLGICRGHQVVNVALGGTLFQDIQTQNPGAFKHRCATIYQDNHHDLRLDKGTQLARVFGGVGEGRINSVHHQAVKDLAPGLAVEAWSKDDGIVEAIRLKDAAAYLAGVQWHPEFQDPADRALLSPSPVIEDLLAAARKRRS